MKLKVHKARRYPRGMQSSGISTWVLCGNNWKLIPARDWLDWTPTQRSENWRDVTCKTCLRLRTLKVNGPCS